MELRGITWDHARGYNPLIPATETFQACHQGVTVRWERRSLKDFGDYPVSRLAENYDLIIVDHPFIPEAGEKKLLLNLNGYFSPALIQELQTQSVGRSFESYYARDALLAVPVDAACEVAAVNAPFFARCGYSAPETLEELFALKEQLAPEFQVGFPFWPTDLLCVFLNLAAQKAGMRYFDLRCGMEKTAGEAAAAMLGKLAEIAQPDAFDMSPIDLWDEMSARENIVYGAFGFGYTNYSRDGYRNILLEYHDAPLWSKDAEVSTVLGGVGLAVSGKIAAEKIPAAVAYLQHVASTEVQTGIYTEHDGQPAALAAWLDARNNRMTHNFFQNTLRTHEKAFLRPRVPEWPFFHAEAGIQLQKDLKEHKTPEALVCNFNRLYQDMCVKA